MPARTHPHPRRSAGLRAAAVPALFALLTSLSACSGDDSDAAPAPDAGSPTSTPSTEAPTVTTQATVGRVVGDFDPSARGKLRGRVQAAVDAWIDAAYLGEYPRSPDDGDPFASFSPRARELAERDRDLLSNAGLAERLDGAEALARRLQIDVLADDGAAAGVTARLRLDLRLSGPEAEVNRDERISGRLFLTYDARAKGWSIFGYEVKRREIR